MKALSQEEKRRELREVADDSEHASVEDMLFRNFYRCDTCGHEWTDVWSAQCDDDCPHCGARHMSPYKSQDAEEGDDE